jgi:hypothetical protein
MTEAITANENGFAEDFFQQLSLVGKILVRPFPSTFRSILDRPSIRITATLVLVGIAQLGANAIQAANGNEFFNEWTLAVPIYLLLAAYATNNMCKDFFRGQRQIFKQLFLAMVAIYFASIAINGVLTGLALVADGFETLVPRLVLLYQITLTILAVHAIASLNFWKSAFAVLIGLIVAGLGMSLIGPFIAMLFFYIQ